MFRVVSKAIIVKDGKMLLLKRNRNLTKKRTLWDVPGGGIERGESFEEGLHREVKEECGLSIEVMDIVKAWTVYDYDVQVAGITYLTKYASGEVALSDEHEEYKWVTLDECENLEIDKWVKKEAKLAFEKLNS